MAVKEKDDVLPEEDIEWNVDTEVQLFYAMTGHKPVGVNKYFQMACILEKFRNSVNKDVSSKVIWEHLDTMYDMQALDDTENLPFPNDEKEFDLPEHDFGDLMKKKAKVEVGEGAEKEVKREVNFVKNNKDTPKKEAKDGDAREALREVKKETPKDVKKVGKDVRRDSKDSVREVRKENKKESKDVAVATPTSKEVLRQEESKEQKKRAASKKDARKDDSDDLPLIALNSGRKEDTAATPRRGAPSLGSAGSATKRATRGKGDDNGSTTTGGTNPQQQSPSPTPPPVKRRRT